MKKIILPIVIVALGCAQHANAQVGINTPTPAATLDVTAKNATGTTTTAEGLLIPRVDRQRAQSMTDVPTSTLVYVNSIATGTATGTAANIDAVGYYYYNGTAWTKLTAGGSANNIYTADGTLGANRTVTQGDKTLAFTGTATNAFSVDGTTFSVDASNNRVGIGTAAPHAPLQFANTEGNRKIVLYEGTDNDHQYYGLGINSSLLRYQLDGTSASHAFFAGSSATASTELMRITGTGRVGIGTTSPGQRLSVVDGVDTNQYNGIGSFFANNLTSGVGIGYAGIQSIGSNANVDLNLNAKGTGNIIMQTNGTTGNVGIGTTTPHAPLQFANTTAGRKMVFYEAGNNDHQYYGLGVNDSALRYQVDGTSANHVFYAASSATASNELMRITGTGRVGIGTSSPQNALHVNGAVQVTGELNLGGTATTAGSAGTTGQVLTSNGAGAAPSWSAAPADTNTNIYSNDGTLAGNRTVTQGANTLAFTGSATNAFSVDGTTLSVDAANNRVGVGTASPHGELQLGNTTGNRKIVLYEGTDNDHQYYGLGINNSLLRYQLDGTSASHAFYAAASATSSNELMRITGTGRVGIGATAPENALTVVDGTSGNDYSIGTFTHSNLTQGVGIGWTGIQSRGTNTDIDLNLNAKGTGDILLQTSGTTGNVGIGTTAPSNALHINRTNPLRLEGLQNASDTAGTLTVNSTGVTQVRNASSISAVRVTGNITFAINNTSYFNDVTAGPTETFDNLNEFSGHTFTAAETGLYSVSFITRYLQADGPFMGYVYIYAGNGPTPPVYGTFEMDYITQVLSGLSKYNIPVTKNELIKLDAGQILQFKMATFGAGANNTGNYTINIVRVD